MVFEWAQRLPENKWERRFFTVLLPCLKLLNFF